MSLSRDLHQDYFYRKFHRGKLQEVNGDISSNAQKTADLDYKADEEFQSKNFVDQFGTMLRADPAKWRTMDTYNELCALFWNDKKTNVETYVIADGQGLSQSDQRQWFRSTLRFISLIVPVDDQHPKNSRASISSVSWAPWFICIAASAAINSDEDILHIMSWSQKDGQFRYYARDMLQLPTKKIAEDKPEMESKVDAKPGDRAWIYLCKSGDAFDEKGSAYLGPLNGHVNGGLAMKEIHKPWLHWLSGGRNMSEMLSAPLRAEIEKAEWLTAPGYPALYGASVKSAESFESIVIDSLRTWTDRRQAKDFLNEDGSTKDSPDNLQRWAAHFLLTTNTNIIATPTAEPIVPTDFFFNYEALRGYGDLLPNSRQNDPNWQKLHPDHDEALSKLRTDFDNGELENTELRIKDWTPAGWYSTYFIPQFSYDPQQYIAAARKLKLCIMQEVEPGTEDAVEFDPKFMTGGVYMGSLENGWFQVLGERNIAFAVTQWGEGDFPWVTLQASVEDALGIWKAQQMFLGEDRDHAPCHLFSEKVFNALMMVDFWNPIFSWKRLRLMQYIPASANLVKVDNLDPSIKEEIYTYDLEAKFLQNIKDVEHQWKTQKVSPEREFMENLEKSLITQQIRIFRWASSVNSNLKTLKGNLDYLRLAESRRRLFRPLPMNFFGSNLPYCLAIPIDAPYLEMTESGDVREIPEIGLTWLGQWLGSLAGSDPTIIPREGVEDDRLKHEKPPLDRKMLPRGAASRMQCQASIVMTNPRSAGSCPFLKSAYKQHLVS